MNQAEQYELSESSRRYWQRRGLFPDPADTSLIGQRRRRFLEQCLEMGFRPARLMKLKQAASRQQKELHQLIVYRADGGMLSSDLVVRNGEVIEELGSGQMLFAFAESGGEVTSLQQRRDPLEVLFVDDPGDDELEHRLAAFTESNPASLEAWIELGNVRFRQSDFQGALQSYETALALDDLCAEALYNMAGCHVQLKSYAAAIRAYHRSIQIRPLPEALYSLGLLYLSLNYRDPAIQTLQAVVQAGPGEWADSARQFIEDIEQLSLYGEME